MTSAGGPDPEFTLQGSGHAVTSLQYLSGQTDSQEHGLLLSGNQNGDIHSWNLRSRRSIHTTSAHPGQPVLSIKQLSTNQILSYGRDGLVHIWDCRGPDWHQSWKRKSGMMSFCQCEVTKSSAQSWLALPGENQSDVEIIDLTSKTKVMTLRPSSGERAYGMCMDIRVVQTPSSDHIVFLVGYEDGSVVLWDVQKRAELCKYKSHLDSVMCLDYNVNSGKGVSGSVDDKLHVWKITDTQSIEPVKHISLTNPGVNSVRFRKDSKIFVTAGWDGHLRVFGVKKLNPLAVLSYHTQSVQSLAYSDQGQLASGGKDSLICIWSIYR